MPEPKVYLAETLAIRATKTEPLDGTVKAAQSFIDEITSSAWWKSTCRPSWLGTGPLRSVWFPYEVSAVPTRVRAKRGEKKGSNVIAWVSGHAPVKHYSKYYPTMYFTRNMAYGDVPAIADQWTILHELAHVATFDLPGHHHREFLLVYLELAKRYLGLEHYEALKEALREQKVRLDYRLL